MAPPPRGLECTISLPSEKTYSNITCLANVETATRIIRVLFILKDKIKICKSSLNNFHLLQILKTFGDVLLVCDLQLDVDRVAF